MNFWNILFAQKHGGSSTTDFFEKLLAENTKPSKIKTLTGVPPLTFVSDGSNIVDWSISGAAGGVGEQTKNLCEILIPNGFERNGVVATVDKNAGTITINGDTSFQSSGFSIPLDNSLNPITGISGSYTLTGCPDGGSTTTFDLYIYDITDSKILSPRIYSSTESATFTADPLHEYRVYIQLRKANIYNDVTFRPMFRAADTSSDFEPFGYKIPVTCGGVTTNIFTQSQLMDGDVLTFADTGVDIPTSNGSNTLTVGTTVQPSSMTIKFKGK